MEQDVNTGKRKLTIRHLGPIRSADICLKYVNVVIGEQSSGKSCLLKTACYCTWVEKRIEIEQSIDRFTRGDAFIQLLIQFHKMDDFVSKGTEIAYESDYMRFSYVHKHFGALAEAYFDNKLKDASVNVQRRSKTYEAFARLPETFTSEDVMRCFGLTSDGAVRSKTRRLMSDHLIEKVSDGRGTTTGLSTFRKTGVQML